MMFGLTEAHAAGALAMVMVGVNLQIAPGIPLMNNAVLDGVVIMILISCIISSIATDQAAKKLKVQGSSTDKKTRRDSTALDDEKILIPINEPGNIGTLMSTAFMMRNRQLNRGLKAITGVNTQQYVNRIRLEQARELLMEHPELQVSEIAYKCGFDDVASFSRAFRRTFGKSPSQHRNGDK